MKCIRPLLQSKILRLLVFILAVYFISETLIVLMTPKSEPIVYIYHDYKDKEDKIEITRSLDEGRVEKLREQIIETTSFQGKISNLLLSLYPPAYDINIIGKSFFNIVGLRGEETRHEATTLCFEESESYKEYPSGSVLFKKGDMSFQESGNIVYKITAFLNGCAPILGDKNTLLKIPPGHSFYVSESYQVDFGMNSYGKWIFRLFSVYLFSIIIQTLVTIYKFIISRAVVENRVFKNSL